MLSSKFDRVSTLLLSLTLTACGGTGDVSSDTDAQGPKVDAPTSVADASIPGIPCKADYRESLDSTNNGIVDENNQIEPTGLVLSGQNDFSICGQVDPTQAGPLFDDVDVFSFALSGDQPIRLRIQTDDNDSISQLRIALFSAEGPVDIASGLLQGNHALIHRELDLGLYWIAVFAKTRKGAAPIGYRIDVTKSRASCESNADSMTSYQESQDGQDNRNNDTLTIDYSESSNFELTDVDSDSPEQTATPIADGGLLSISGRTALVPALDDYMDRDSYSIVTGPTTEELSLRLAWDQNAGTDLDLHVFSAGTPIPDLSFGGASTVGTSGEEMTTLAVSPNTEYWLWVGQHDAPTINPPQDYQLDVCGASLAPN